VGHFWLTNGLAFLPMHGSALYIDVRLVAHCSDPCTVHNARSDLEGRYGEGVCNTGKGCGMRLVHATSTGRQGLHVCAAHTCMHQGLQVKRGRAF
jgi:hypothetical protein